MPALHTARCISRKEYQLFGGQGQQAQLIASIRVHSHIPEALYRAPKEETSL